MHEASSPHRALAQTCCYCGNHWISVRSLSGKTSKTGAGDEKHCTASRSLRLRIAQPSPPVAQRLLPPGAERHEGEGASAAGAVPATARHARRVLRRRARQQPRARRSTPVVPVPLRRLRLRLRFSSPFSCFLLCCPHHRAAQR